VNPKRQKVTVERRQLHGGGGGGPRFVLFAEEYQGDQIVEDGADRACSTHGGDVKV
jgi:hypothetical protein